MVQRDVTFHQSIYNRYSICIKIKMGEWCEQFEYYFIKKGVIINLNGSDHWSEKC